MNAIIFAGVGTLGIFILFNVPRLLRRGVTIGIWFLTQVDALADTLDDLFPHWLRGLAGMWTFWQQRQRAYFEEAMEKR